MSTEQNKTISRRIFDEVWNKGNLAVVDETSAPTLVNHFTPPGIPAGRVGFKQFAQVYRAGFPDLHFTIDDMIAEGDKVVTRFTATGTHTGELFGMPATGKKATVTGITIARYDATGKSAEVWTNFDQLGMLQQLGVVPTPAPAKN
jgi:steroid delta-isomerase-like uncharacterized protein